MAGGGGKFTGKTVKEAVWPRRSWEIGAFLGAGACAEIYDVVPTKPGSLGEEDARRRWVAKVSPLPSPPPPKKGRKRSPEELAADVLHMEHSIYRNNLLNRPGVPLMPRDGGYGDDAAVGLRFLIIEKLGMTLRDVADSEGGLSPARAAHFGKQIIKALQMLHEECRLLFVDMKPENLMVGLPGGSGVDSLSLVDFGLSRPYLGKGGVHRPLAQTGVEGTPTFLSLASHGGATPARRDDLEATAYVLLSAMGHPLPWSRAKSDDEGFKIKRAEDLSKLCIDVPPLAKWIKMARDTPYESAPDYGAYLKILDEIGRLTPSSKKRPSAEPSPAKAGGRTLAKKKKGSATSERMDAVLSEKAGARTPSRSQKNSINPLNSAGKKGGKEKEVVDLTSSTPSRNAKKSPLNVRSAAKPPSSVPAKNKGSAAMKDQAPGPRHFRLICCEGPHKGQIVSLEGLHSDMGLGYSLTLGSEDGADILIKGDQLLSGFHLEVSLSCSEDAIKVKDLGSYNGTKINEKAISRRSRGSSLRINDILTVGRSQFMLDFDE